MKKYIITILLLVSHLIAFIAGYEFSQVKKNSTNPQITFNEKDFEKVTYSYSEKGVVKYTFTYPNPALVDTIYPENSDQFIVYEHNSKPTLLIGIDVGSDPVLQVGSNVTGKGETIKIK